MATPDPRTAPEPSLGPAIGGGEGSAGWVRAGLWSQTDQDWNPSLWTLSRVGRAWLLLGDTMQGPDTRAGGVAPTGGSGSASTHPALLGGAPASHLTRASACCVFCHRACPWDEDTFVVALDEKQPQL